MKALLLVSAIAGMSAAATLGAQGVREKPDSTCTKYSDGRTECRVFRRFPGDSAFGTGMFLRMDSAMAKRAALGIELRATGTRRDTLGVFVEGVTPKGPAEAAGIIEGDRIASINGVDLRTPAADIDDSYSNEVATHRLTREVRKLSPGTRVTLRVYSGGRFRDVQVVAGKATDIMRFGGQFRMGFPGGDGMMELDGPGIVRLRNPVRVRPLSPLRTRAMKVEDSAGLKPQLVTEDVIRALAANAARGAASALKQLAADGVA
ncbi:MAG TPA: PDZ domain-containing protein [Gemmatimonadaceae bacterium]|nr:PDZ domain-containing protein [Gemmatimonadaceae bacterium]